FRRVLFQKFHVNNAVVFLLNVLHAFFDYKARRYMYQDNAYIGWFSFHFGNVFSFQFVLILSYRGQMHENTYFEIHTIYSAKIVVLMKSSTHIHNGDTL